MGNKFSQNLSKFHFKWESKSASHSPKSAAVAVGHYRHAWGNCASTLVILTYFKSLWNVLYLCEPIWPAQAVLRNPRIIFMEFEFILGLLKCRNWGQLWVDSDPHPPDCLTVGKMSYNDDRLGPDWAKKVPKMGKTFLEKTTSGQTKSCTFAFVYLCWGYAMQLHSHSSNCCIYAALLLSLELICKCWARHQTGRGRGCFLGVGCFWKGLFGRVGGGGGGGACSIRKRRRFTALYYHNCSGTTSQVIPQMSRW